MRKFNELSAIALAWGLACIGLVQQVLPGMIANSEANQRQTESVLHAQTMMIQLAASNFAVDAYEEVTIYSEEDVLELARIIYFEARGEDERGKLMVANVVINRMNSASYPSTIAGVIHQSGQFSPTKRSDYYRTTIPQSYEEIARRALSGETELCCDNILYFNAAGVARHFRGAYFWHGGHVFGHGKGGCTATYEEAIAEKRVDMMHTQ